MKLSDLRPASDYAKRYGVKCVIFGGPGSGKTPLMGTAPRPVACVTEPGLLSMRSSNLPVFMAETLEKILDFKKWLLESNEAKNFDTVQFDSLTNIAEISLKAKSARHGKQAYGAMAEEVFGFCNDLFYLPQKHVILIAKETQVENGKTQQFEGGQVVVTPVMQKRPSLPGQILNVQIPHLFDTVMHLGKASIPGQPQPVRALRTIEIPEIFARERSGKLAELEPPDLTYIFNKALS